eukprot:6140017-Pyramimonas_sp.AAC.1
MHYKCRASKTWDNAGGYKAVIRADRPPLTLTEEAAGRSGAAPACGLPRGGHPGPEGPPARGQAQEGERRSVWPRGPPAAPAQ